jgi:NAD(P)H dehydrogenase (quinone)
VQVRPAVFLQNFFSAWAAESIAKDATIWLPFGAGRSSPVDVRDVAEVIAAVLASPTVHSR